MSDWAYSNNPLSTQVIHISGPVVSDDGFYKQWLRANREANSMMNWRYVD